MISKASLKRAAASPNRPAENAAVALFFFSIYSGSGSPSAVAVMGVAAILNDDRFQMLACSRCKRQVQEGVCTEHPDAPTEQRWLLNLDIADQTAGGGATLYHDAAVTVDILSGDTTDPKIKQKICREFKARPWSMRVVLKVNELTQSSYLEIKRLAPTITMEGVVGSYRIAIAPRVADDFGGRDAGSACPFAHCADVTFDKGLGVVFAHGRQVVAARLLVAMQAVDEDDEVAKPDSNNVGLRISREVRCAFNGEDATKYTLQTAGLGGAVQWLLSALEGDTFLVTAVPRSEDAAFQVLAYIKLDKIGGDMFKHFMKDAIDPTQRVPITLSVTETPQKRQIQLDAAVPDCAPDAAFCKRVKLPSVGQPSED